MSLLDILKFFFGSKQDRDLRKLKPMLEYVNRFKDAVRSLTGEQLKTTPREAQFAFANARGIGIRIGRQ